MKEVIESPFRDCKAHLKRVPDSIEFRGKVYHFLNHYYVCEETGEGFTDEITGEINFSQVYNQHREENNIPYVQEIIKLRDDCQLSYSDMDKVLGFGENQYYRYEMGEVPSLSNGKLIRVLIDNRAALIATIQDSKIDTNNKEKTIRALEDLIALENEEKPIYQLLFPTKSTIYNGYAIPSVNKVRQMILYFLGYMPKGYKTALNKLMFYSDFLMYKEFGIGISGLTYSALSFGNGPMNSKVLYGMFDEVEEADVEESYFKPLRVCDLSVFNKQEIMILEQVASKMVKMPCNELSEINQQEDTWLKYKHDPKLRIPYNEAFNLKAF